MTVCQRIYWDLKLHLEVGRRIICLYKRLGAAGLMPAAASICQILSAVRKESRNQSLPLRDYSVGFHRLCVLLGAWVQRSRRVVTQEVPGRKPGGDRGAVSGGHARGGDGAAQPGQHRDQPGGRHRSGRGGRRRAALLGHCCAARPAAAAARAAARHLLPAATCPLPGLAPQGAHPHVLLPQSSEFVCGHIASASCVRRQAVIVVTHQNCMLVRCRIHTVYRDVSMNR